MTQQPDIFPHNWRLAECEQEHAALMVGRLHGHDVDGEIYPDGAADNNTWSFFIYCRRYSCGTLASREAQLPCPGGEAHA